MRDKILVTGANGFVGQAFCRYLTACGKGLIGVARNAVQARALAEVQPIGDYHTADWNRLLSEVSAVVHLAARAHVMRERQPDFLDEYRAVNVALTEHLLERAHAAGVRRFVYLSSIKVNGEVSAQPFTESDLPRPEDAYGQSKWEAEQAVARYSDRLETVVVRAPLVYGQGVKGNFLKLLSVVAKRWPLPFARIVNQRSFIYVENLASALLVASIHPQAVTQTYLVSDGQDLSTPQLVNELAQALEVKPRLFRCPIPVLALLGRLSGRSEIVRRLTNSLQIDSSKIRLQLGWRAEHTVQEGLRTMAQWYRRAHV